MHGGDIFMKSDGTDRGSVFTLRLPVLTESQAADAEPAPPSLETPIRRRVLIADDNRAATEMLSLILQDLGHDVRIANDGEETVAIARDFVPELLLLDLGMPRLRGDEAARLIRQQPWGKSMTLIALTGWGQESDRQRTHDAGFDGHFVKPIGVEQLRQLLADLDKPSGD